MNTIDKRAVVEGAITDDVMYGDKGQILKPIKANSIAEERKIDELMSRYPNLDHLMCAITIYKIKEKRIDLILIDLNLTRCTSATTTTFWWKKKKKNQ